MVVRTTTKAVLRLLFDPGPAENLQVLGTTSPLSHQGLLAAPTLVRPPSASLPPGLRSACPSEQRCSLPSLYPETTTHPTPRVSPPYHSLPPDSLAGVYSVCSVSPVSAECGPSQGYALYT